MLFNIIKLADIFFFFFFFFYIIPIFPRKQIFHVNFPRMKCQALFSWKIFYSLIFIGALLKSTHSVCFHGEIRKTFIWILLLSGMRFGILHSFQQSYRDDGRMIIKGSVQRCAIQSWLEFHVQWDLKPGISWSEVRNANHLATWILPGDMDYANESPDQWSDGADVVSKCPENIFYNDIVQIISITCPPYL